MTEPNTPVAAQHAFEAGLDVVFQSSYGQQRPYLDAFQRGLIAPAIIDAAVARVLRAKFELGLFEQPVRRRRRPRVRTATRITSRSRAKRRARRWCC